MTEYPAPTDAATIYDELGVPRVINGAGTRTRVGGTRMRPAAVEAMTRTAGSFARISDLQARASQAIADATGAQAGYVVTGAAAGLTMATAACMVGGDPAAMDQLPDAEGLPDEVVMPLVHSNAYDRALRAAGATIVSAGTNDRQLGAGASSLEPWELRAAFGDRTAALALVPRDDLPLEPAIEVARSEDVPVIVDAAGLLPPRRNLTRFMDLGADLVVFSGGKGIRGPQSTGLIAGRQDLIASVAAQHLDMDAMAATWNPPLELLDASTMEGVPRHGLGRGFKVGKEELVGFITAFERFVDGDDAADYADWDDRARRIGEQLAEKDFDVDYPGGDKMDAVTTVSVAVDPDLTGTTARDLVVALGTEDPHVVVGDRDIESGRITVDPRSLTDAEADYLVDRVHANCTPESRT